MNKLTGTILTLPKMSGNVGAKTIYIGGKGDDGATFTPSVSADGIISWTNDKDLPNPEPVNIKGTKGDKGDKGDRGLQGVQGIQGERGEQGQKGDKGDRGEQGIQGIQGAKGETGAQGQKGADGTPATHRWSGTTLHITSASGTSSANLKGDKGDKGETGPQGPKGDTGDTGPQGPKGETGATGPQGPAGPEGAQGKPGANGTDGKSAYAYAQDAGYTGTEEEFAEKLAQGPLVGETDKITPYQVLEAIVANRDVGITYTDTVFGAFHFTSFDLNASVGVVFSSSILQYNGMYAVVELIGYMDTGKWEFIIQQIPIMSDIPVPVIGTTAEVTPSQVKSLMDAGKPFAVTHTDNLYGSMLFNSFVYAQAIGTVVISSTVFRAGDITYCAQLIGDYIHENWMFDGFQLAAYSDIPTIPESLKNPYALTINGTKYDGSKAVNMTIAAGNADTIPDYVRTEAERVAAVVQSRQNADTLTFLAASDFHYSTKVSNAAQQKESLTHMGQAMELIRKKVHIDFTVSCGDMVWDSGETVEEATAAMRFVSECLQNGQADLRTRGNHDCLYSNAAGLTDAQIFANIGAWNSGAQYDPDNRLGGYCYRDFENVKIRVICLNSSETDTGGCLFSAKQVAWLSDALNLSEKGEDWRSIVVSHHPLDWGKDGGGNPITAINGAAGVIAAFHGHTHNFKVDTVTGASIKRIAIPNSCFGRENEYTTAYNITWGEDTKYTKTSGTAADTSFCVITIDRAACKIYADHYGAGYSREVEYVDAGDSGGSSYVNAVDTAEADDSTDLYNGTGYKVGVYCSSSGGDSEDTACVATGNMPYNWATDNPIYIKGAKVTDASHVRIYGYSTKGAAPLSATCCSGPTMSTYFTREEPETGNYYKLTPKGDIPQVKYLRLSLIDTGNKPIVSFGKPIE